MGAQAVQIGIALVEMLGLYAVAVFAGAGGGVLIAKTYLTTKIKEAVKHEYAEKLETLRANLASENNKQLEMLKAQLTSESSAQLEILKARLKTQSDVAIERFKSDLTIQAAQRNVEFTQLHTARAETIAEIHADLRDAVDMLSDYTKPFEPVGGTSRKERGEKAVGAINKFLRTFRTKEIYLPEPTADKLREIADQLKFAFYRYLYGVDLGDNMGENRSKKLLEIFETVEKLSGPATRELQNDFRGLLGYRPPDQKLITQEQK